MKLDLEFREYDSGNTIWKTMEVLPAVGLGLVPGDDIVLPNKNPVGPPRPSYKVHSRWVKFVSGDLLYVVIMLDTV